MAQVYTKAVQANQNKKSTIDSYIKAVLWWIFIYQIIKLAVLWVALAGFDDYERLGGEGDFAAGDFAFADFKYLFAVKGKRSVC